MVFGSGKNLSNVIREGEGHYTKGERLILKLKLIKGEGAGDNRIFSKKVLI